MKFDKKEAAGQPLSFSAPKNPQWVMLAALLLSYAAGYEYVDRCLGFGVASEYSAWRAGVLVFVALYTVVVELAAWAGDRKPSRTAAAWWCCWLVQSLAMAGWSLHTDDLGFWQVVAWHCTAIYYVLARNDLLAAGRTSCLRCWMAWRACLPSHLATFCCVPSCCGRHCTAGGPIMRDAKAARWKPPSV